MRKTTKRKRALLDGDPLNPLGVFQADARKLEQRLLVAVEPGEGNEDTSLMTLRPLFRDALELDSPLPLALILRDGDPRLRPIVVWLLSRSTSRCHLLGISDHKDSTDRSLRKHVAKALRSLEARPQLLEMAQSWPDDPWVQRFARDRVPRLFNKRLARFTANRGEVSDIPATSPMPLYVSHQSWTFSPPRSRWYIRRLLLRIQRWTRGHSFS